MFVKMESNQVASIFRGRERQDDPDLELWPQLEKHFQHQMAHCWAKLILRILQQRQEGTGGKYDPSG